MDPRKPFEENISITDPQRDPAAYHLYVGLRDMAQLLRDVDSQVRAQQQQLDRIEATVQALQARKP